MQNYRSHTVRNLHFSYKNSTVISRENCRLFGWKTRETVVVLDFLAVDNFDFTRKIVKKNFADKTRENVGVLSKLNFWTKIWQNPNIFTSFSPVTFLTIILVKSKLSTAKKSKTTTFSRVFHPKKIDNFSREIKVEFLEKNEDFEQCTVRNLTIFPLLAELQGSIANSLADVDMASPVFCTSSTAWIISGSMSGFSKAICCPLSTKLAVARSTAATKTWALLDFPFFFCGDFEETNVVT